MSQGAMRAHLGQDEATSSKLKPDARGTKRQSEEGEEVEEVFAI
jgi:hypothetical protein